MKTRARHQRIAYINRTLLRLSKLMALAAGIYFLLDVIFGLRSLHPIYWLISVTGHLSTIICCSLVPISLAFVLRVAFRQQGTGFNANMRTAKQAALFTIITGILMFGVVVIG